MIPTLVWQPFIDIFQIKRKWQYRPPCIAGTPAFIALAEESRKRYRGGDQICSLFYGYISLFITKPEVYRFMLDFDNYISRLNKSPSTLSQYDELLQSYNSQIADMISLGVRDEILKSRENMGQYYSMMFNAIVAFAQKLLNRRSIGNRDRLWKDAEQMTLLVETLISNYNGQLKGSYIMRDLNQPELNNF